MPSARGLTLIELMVVLVVLTVLGMVVVTNTAQLVTDARSEVTISTVDALYEGVIGRKSRPLEDPTSVLGGFISDIGRLPLVNQVFVNGVRDDFGGFANGVPVLTPGELWDPGPPDLDALPVHRLDSHPSDPEFEFPTGWRGPYVNLRGGALAQNAQTRDRAVLDGTRRAMRVFNTDGVDAGVGDRFAGILGSTSIASVSLDWSFENADAVGFLLRDDSDAAAFDQTRGVVAFDLDPSGTGPGLTGVDTETQMVVVRLYGPIDGLPSVLAQWPLEGEGLPATPRGLHTFRQVSGEPVEVSIGLRYLRIYRWNSTAAPAANAVMSGIGAEPGVEGSIGTRSFTVLPGGPAVPPRLEIPPAP